MGETLVKTGRVQIEKSQCKLKNAERLVNTGGVQIKCKNRKIGGGGSQRSTAKNSKIRQHHFFKIKIKF